VSLQTLHLAHDKGLRENGKLFEEVSKADWARHGRIVSGCGHLWQCESPSPLAKSAHRTDDSGVLYLIVAKLSIATALGAVIVLAL
jgi:hypothetical protein